MYKGLTTRRVHNLGFDWPLGISIQCAIFLSFGFDFILDSKDILLFFLLVVFAAINRFWPIFCLSNRIVTFIIAMAK